MMKDDDFKLFRGFADGQTKERTDICDCRVAFATENHILELLYAVSNFRFQGFRTFIVNMKKEFYHSLGLLRSVLSHGAGVAVSRGRLCLSCWNESNPIGL